MLRQDSNTEDDWPAAVRLFRNGGSPSETAKYNITDSFMMAHMYVQMSSM